MASEDLTSATDLILGVLKAAWDAGAQAAAGAASVPTLVYEATERDLRPHPAASGAPWARVTVRHFDAVSAAIGGPDGHTRRFSRTGLAWVQIFIANVDGAAYSKSEALAKLVQSAYEGKRAGGVVFTKAIQKEMGQEALWYRRDVLVSFNWTEIKP